MKIYVSLSTIPFRFNKIYIAINSLINQSVIPDKIFLNIPINYKRFPNESILESDIIKLQKKYGEILQINRLSTDYGPGTKLIGTIPYINFKEDGILILVDDDVIYKRDMIKGFVDNYRDNMNEHNCYSYYKYKLFIEHEEIVLGQGVDGFALPFKCLIKLMEYVSLLDIEKICSDDEYDKMYLFLHDDLWISYYLHLINYNIINISTKYEAIYLQFNKYIKKNNKYDLHLIINKYCRESCCMEGLQILNSLKQNGIFDNINKIEKNITN
jgi:hypothetical protein